MHQCNACFWFAVQLIPLCAKVVVDHEADNFNPLKDWDGLWGKKNNFKEKEKKNKKREREWAPYCTLFYLSGSPSSEYFFLFSKAYQAYELSRD